MLSESDQKFIKDWEENLENGWLHYSLFIGTIAGMIMFLVPPLLSLGTQSFFDLYCSKEALYRLIITIPGAILGYGFIMWPIMNWTYKSKLKERDEGKLNINAGKTKIVLNKTLSIKQSTPTKEKIKTL